LIQQITVTEWNSSDTKQRTTKHRVRREYKSDHKVYLEAIGQPRGIPKEYKARNDVKSGFESIFLWIASKKI
jgi:hypothetical protein